MNLKESGYRQYKDEIKFQKSRIQRYYIIQQR
jgi:hypothetical protein